MADELVSWKPADPGTTVGRLYDTVTAFTAKPRLRQALEAMLLP